MQTGGTLEMENLVNEQELQRKVKPTEYKRKKKESWALKIPLRK